MPWTISTYAGTYMGGSPSNARVALFELMRGVNEREGAMGIAKTQFLKTDGSNASDLSMSDILNIRATGINSPVDTNLKRVRNSIIGWLGAQRFTTTSGGETIYTKAQLESDIGEDLDADPIRPQEARYWQAMQDALDRLIFAKATVSPSISTATREDHTVSSVAAVASDSEYEDIWDDRNYHIQLSGFANEVGWVARSYTTTLRGMEMRRKTSGIIFSTTSLDGTLVSAFYNYLVDWEDYNGSQFNVSIGTANAIPTAGGTGRVAAYDLALGTNNSVDIEVVETEPADIPFDKPGVGTPYTGLIILALNGITLYFDLAPILSDQ